jgi:DNA-binding CsgD family transcriptional regulator
MPGQWDPTPVDVGPGGAPLSGPLPAPALMQAHWSASVEEPVVGRERELSATEPFLDRVPSGVCALVVEGEPGIGKTTIWRALGSKAAERGYRVLACQAEQTEARLSFVGLGDLVGSDASGFLAQLPDAQRLALGMVLLRDVPSDDRGADPRMVAVAFTNLLAEFARASSLLVAVDDLQWLDSSTARVLAFAIRRLHSHPVGLLVTVRSPASASDPLGLERAFGDSLEHLRLGPLSLGALRNILDLHLGRGYARPTLVKIAEASGGNPLFALEIARALGANAVVEPGMRLPVPESLHELVAERIPKLAAAAREALLAAAALSHPTAELVEHASSVAGLASAEESGLLRVEHGRVVFAHPLYASAVYAAVATSRRHQLHRRLAQLVTDPEEQARHLALATTEPDEKVARTLERAAQVARARGAWDSAADFLERARSLTPPDWPDAGRRRGISAAEHHIHAGDRQRARTLLETLITDDLPESVRAEALRLLGEISYNDENYPEAQRVLEQALEHANDPELAAMVELRLSYVLANSGDFGRGREHGHRALAQAEASRSGPLVGEALADCAITDFLCGGGVDWDKVERSLVLEDPRRVLPLQNRPSVIAAALAFYVGRLAEGRERLSALRAWSLERGDESDLAWLDAMLSWLETMSGQFETASLLSDESELLARLTASRSLHGLALSQRALVRAHQGKIAETRNDCAQAMMVAAGTNYIIPVVWVAASLGLLELSLGNAAGAWQACAGLTEALEAHGIGEPITVPYFLPAAVEALVALHQLDRAEALLDAFERRGRELDRAWALATGERCRGLLLAARGDLAGAAAALDRALLEHARLEMPFELGRTLLVQGQLHRRRREKRLARTSLERALELFEGMRAPLWADRARAEMARLGLRTAPGDLTPTEERVAALAASGLTTRAIATTLFVSPKTVEANLGRAYQKLGVGSRAELGAVMARRR